MWLHLPLVHSALFKTSVAIEDPVWNLIWYCVMPPLGPGHDSPGSTGCWRETHMMLKMVFIKLSKAEIILYLLIGGIAFKKLTLNLQTYLVGIS